MTITEQKAFLRSYTGQAQDGDMILNDVGAQYDNMITDVSRG